MKKYGWNGKIKSEFYNIVIKEIPMPAFASPPNPQAYYEQVWNIVRQIPVGKVATYGQIAKMIPASQWRGNRNLCRIRSALGGRRNGSLPR